MFGNLNDNINSIECIGKEIINLSDGGGIRVAELTAPEGASRAILQFFTTDEGVTSPVATIAEFGTPSVGFNTATEDAGFHLFNMAIYEVRGFKNIQNTKLIAFSETVSCYCSIQYYK